MEAITHEGLTSLQRSLGTRGTARKPFDIQSLEALWENEYIPGVGQGRRGQRQRGSY